MFKVRQILQHYSAGRDNKFIRKSNAIACNMVRKYVVKFDELRLTVERVEAMSDELLASYFLIEKPKNESSRVID